MGVGFAVYTNHAKCNAIVCHRVTMPITAHLASWMLNGPSFLRPRPESTQRHRTDRTVSHLKAVCSELVFPLPLPPDCQPLFYWGWQPRSGRAPPSCLGALAFAT